MAHRTGGNDGNQYGGTYGQSPYDQGGSPYENPQASPYGQQGQPDPYAQRQTSRRGRQNPARDARAAQQQGRVYGEGRGRAYTSTQPGQAPNRGSAVGVRPVSRDEYIPGGSPLGNGKDPLVTRRHVLIAGGAAIAGIAALGFGGCAWWTHRAVACEVNGTEHEVPISSPASFLVDKGYANPKNGNLISIPDAEGNTEVLEVGAGNHYTLRVNDQDVDLDSYRVSQGDKIEFVDGTDVTEEVNRQETKVPCGIQISPATDLLNVIGYVSQWGRDGVSTVETGKVSGRTVDRGVTTEPQDLIITHSHVNPADGRKLIALTFDDGPSLDYTPQYLDILARYGAKATFFNLGLNLEEGDDYVALCKRCVDEGHQVASHTYSHDSITLSGFDEAGRNEEISKAFTLVSNASGVPTQVMRPPYGEFRAWQYLQYIAHVGDIAYSAYWGVDSEDWRLLGADHIISQCTANLTADSYNGAVVLMHDGGGDRSQDVQALPQLIETYQGLGYELVTLNELLKSDPTYPTWVTDGYVTRPDDAVIPDITPYLPA